MNMQTINLTLLMQSIAESSPPPIEYDWREWNASADQPYVSAGTNVSESFQSTGVCIFLDALRFFYLYRTDYYLVYAVVGTYDDTGNPPTFGTPVLIDTLPSDAELVAYGVSIDANTVFVTYQSTLVYARMFTTVGNVITAHPVTTFSFDPKLLYLNFPQRCCAVLDSTHVLVSVTTNLVFTDIPALFTVTINNDLTLTQNTVKEFAAYSQSDGYVVALSPTSALFFPAIDGNVLQCAAVSITSGGTVVSDVISSIQISPNNVSSYPPAVAKINSGKVVCLYTDYDGSSIKLLAAQITFNGTTLSKKTDLTIDETTDNGDFINTITTQDLLLTGNDANQLIAFYAISESSQSYYNCKTAILTPSGSTLASANPQLINAGWFDIDAATNFTCFGCMMFTQVAAVPAITYNRGTNFGVTILNRQNTFALPHLIFNLDGDDTSQVGSASLGLSTGTSGASSFVVAGVDVTAQLVADSYVVLNDIRSYIVASSSFNGTDTTVTITGTLITNYSGVTTKLLLLTSWSDSSNYFYNFTAPAANYPQIGFTHGHRTVIFTTNAADAYLSNSAISFPMGADATLFIVAKFNSGYACGVISAATPELMDVGPSSVTYYPTPATSGSFNAKVDLTLITVVRSYGVTSVYINGLLNESATLLALAIGDPLRFIIGNNASINSPFLGEISAVRLYAGAMSGAALTNENNYFTDHFGITFNPLSLGPVFAFDANNPAGNGVIPADMSDITSCVDLTGNGNTVNNDIGSDPLIYRTNQFNGNNVLAANGPSAFLTCDNNSSNAFPTNTSVSAFAIASKSPSDTNDTLLSKGYYPVGGWGLGSEGLTEQISFTVFNVRQFNGLNLWSGTGIYDIVSSIFESGVGCTIYKNAANPEFSADAGGSHQNGFSSLDLCAYQDGNYIWPGNFNYGIVFYRKLSAPEIDAMHTWLLARQGS